MRQFSSMLANHMNTKKPHIFFVKKQLKKANALTNNFTPRSVQIVSAAYHKRGAIGEQRLLCIPPMLTSGIV